MKALVLAAGIGSRLKPWTGSHPKALVEVGGKPMLGRVIENLIAAGIQDIFVNVHHFASQIVDYLDDTAFHARITVSDESALLLDTGGAVRKVAPMAAGDSLLVHNADILTDLILTDLIKSHEESTRGATLVVADRDTNRKLAFDSDMRLHGWTNLSTGATKPEGFEISAGDYLLRAFNGIHILSPEALRIVMDFAPAGTPFSIIDFYLAACRRIEVGGYAMPKKSHWLDVGKPATLEEARKEFNNFQS